MGSKSSSIYSKLAGLYDTLMQDVDYESWADYIDEIMQTHHEDPIDILEMGSGTGSMALSLAELECYSITASDLSSEMLDVAQRKASMDDISLEYLVSSFQELNVQDKFDCIFSFVE